MWTFSTARATIENRSTSNHEILGWVNILKNFIYGFCYQAPNALQGESNSSSTFQTLNGKQLVEFITHCTSLLLIYLKVLLSFKLEVSLVRRRHLIAHSLSNAAVYWQALKIQTFHLHHRCLSAFVLSSFIINIKTILTLHLFVLWYIFLLQYQQRMQGMPTKSPAAKIETSKVICFLKCSKCQINF